MEGIETGVVLGNVIDSPLGRIRLGGYIRDSRGLPRKPLRILGSYALVYLLEGRGSFADANGLNCRVETGDLIFLFPDLAHSYGPGTGETWTEFYLVFEGAVFDLWDRAGVLDRRSPVVRAAPVDYWLPRFAPAVGGLGGPGSTPPLVEICSLQQVLADLLSSDRYPHEEREMGWVSEACALLEARIEGEINLREVASGMNLSYEGFRKKFARLTGTSPSRYRASRKINRACELLQTTDLPVAGVSQMLGFCDEYYFSRRFKQLTGYPPSQFRAKLPTLSTRSESGYSHPRPNAAQEQR